MVHIIGAIKQHRNTKNG